MRVALLATPSRTGIGSYVAALERHLPAALPDADFEVCRLRKTELRVMGRKVGGDLSQRLLRFDPPIPQADVVHATSNHVLHRRANVATIHDLNPLLVAGRPVERLLFRSQGPRLRRMRAVMTDAETVRVQAIEVYGLDAARVHTVPLAVDHDL